jgi:hypothetical protein
MAGKANAHNARVHKAMGEIVQLFGEDHPQLGQLLGLLRTHAKESQLAGLAEAHEKMAGLYGFESHGHEIKKEEI